jgi:hypothetical protein
VRTLVSLGVSATGVAADAAEAVGADVVVLHVCDPQGTSWVHYDPDGFGQELDTSATASVTERRPGFAFCAPVASGGTERGRAFTKEAYEARVDEFTATRRARGLSHELVCLNHTPMGDVICVYYEAEDPDAANRGLAESRDPFDVWFKEQLKTIFPPEIDFDEPVQGITEIFDSEQLLVAH